LQKAITPGMKKVSILPRRIPVFVKISENGHKKAGTLMVPVPSGGFTPCP
jgi:hypothetical protein